jgi:hypothetical protein
MKNILGYLNQNEWIYSLNIGNIMQVAPLTLQDFLSTNALVIELTREYVLEKICFLCVSYFCLGTEFRFLHSRTKSSKASPFKERTVSSGTAKLLSWRSASCLLRVPSSPT